MSARGDRSSYDPWKRILDVISASAGLIVLSPVLVATAVVVRFRLGRPVIFRQDRAGFRGKPFTIFKFRSMRQVDVERGVVSAEDRMTKFGRMLRASSLDELPALLNVLKGDMSMIGPRPLHTRYLDRYTAEQARRHEVRPGMTGLAQVNGRNSLAWEDRFRLDVDYVETRSIGLDLRILWRTGFTIVSRRGISGGGSATMSEFFGNADSQSGNLGEMMDGPGEGRAT